MTTIYFFNLTLQLVFFPLIFHNATLFPEICETGEVFPSKKSRARFVREGRRGGEAISDRSGGGLAHLLFITARSRLLSLEQVSTIDTFEESGEQEEPQVGPATFAPQVLFSATECREVYVSNWESLLVSNQSP